MGGKDNAIWRGIGAGVLGGLLCLICVAAAVWFVWSDLLRQPTTVPPPASLPAEGVRSPTPTLVAGQLPSPAATGAPAMDVAATATTGTAAPTIPGSGANGSVPAGRIVFTCFIDGFDDVCAMNAKGGDLRRLTATAATDFYPEWGPAGDVIIWSSRRSGAFQLFLMDANGRDQRQLTDFGSLFAPDISPDGRRITFTNATGEFQHVWAMDADGAGARALTGGASNNVDPVWSPDGASIAFASDRSGVVKHYVMDADGGNVRLLPDTVAEHGGRSSWSPDGRWLAFYAGPRDDRDVYLVATDGSRRSRRLTDGGRNLAPSFSPDGNWLAFTSYRDGDDAEIFIMRPDGSDVRQLTSNERPDWQPRWGP